MPLSPRRLTKLRQRRAGGPLSFSWVDGTCHLGFVGGFGLSEMDLPTMVVLSPGKKRCLQRASNSQPPEGAAHWPGGCLV
jgi:hypothetical protein